MGDLSEFADSNLGTMPEVSEHAVKAHEEDEAEKARQFADLRDKDGLSFDARFHVTDADGNPKTTNAGKLRRKPGNPTGLREALGRAGMQSITPGSPTEEAKQQETAERARNDARQSAEMTVLSFVTLAKILGGPDFEPSAEEVQGLNDAWGACYEKWGVTDLPPELALVSATGAYFLVNEKRRDKMAEGFARVTQNWREKWGSRRAARFDRGNDAGGEDDTSEGTPVPLPEIGSSKRHFGST